MSFSERLFRKPPEQQWLERRALRQAVGLALVGTLFFLVLLAVTRDLSVAIAAIWPIAVGFVGMAFHFARKLDRLRDEVARHRARGQT